MASSDESKSLMPYVGLVITHPAGFRFQVTRVLATGPFSDVFQVKDLVTNEQYAMKAEREEGNIR